MAIPMPGGSSGGDSGAPDRSRTRFPDISSRAYEHPADRSALVALRSLSGFDAVLKALSGFFRERSHRLMYLASAVRVSERQFPELHRMLMDGVEILDVPGPPELYVTQDPRVGAMTIGMDQPFIVVTTGAVDLYDAEEMRFVIGHELGHVLSGHAVYRTMLMHLINLSRRVWIPIGYLGLRAIISALEEWQRKAELSADRAGLLAGQDESAALRVQMKTAGGSRLHEMDVDAFLEQAREYDAAGDLRDGVLKLLNLEGQSHPFAVLRAADLRRWIADGEYARILAGDYPRRADDGQTSIKDEFAAAARSYRRTFDESADPLMKLLKGVGEEVADVGARIFNRATAARGTQPSGDSGTNGTGGNDSTGGAGG
jgi:Zn-dependent protease with chaperone function